MKQYFILQIKKLKTIADFIKDNIKLFTCYKSFLDAETQIPTNIKKKMILQNYRIPQNLGFVFYKAINNMLLNFS